MSQPINGRIRPIGDRLAHNPGHTETRKESGQVNSHLPNLKPRSHPSTTQSDAPLMTSLAPSTPEQFLFRKPRPLLVYKHDIRQLWRSSKGHLPLPPADHGVLPPATRRQRGTLIVNVLLEKPRSQIRSSFISFTPDAFLPSHREDLCLLAHLDSLGCRCCEIYLLMPPPPNSFHHEHGGCSAHIRYVMDDGPEGFK